MTDTRPGDHRCRGDHAELPSEAVAANMVTLHRLEYPLCPEGAFGAWECEGTDHHHVGHTSKVDGDRCKADHRGYWNGVPPRPAPPG